MATATLTRPEKSLRSTGGMNIEEATEVLRGLCSIRLSVLTDETTSPERQRESCNTAAAALNICFGEDESRREAVDLDVSASEMGPFDRPELGEWLKRADEFDVIVWWRFDRAIRNMNDMHELAKWAKKHRKMLVFAEGLGGTGRLVFDFRNGIDPTSELMLMMFAFAAQVESQSTKDRVRGAQAAIRKMALRFRGGRPSYGYRSAPLEGGGRTLEIDPVALGILRLIIKLLMVEKRTVSAIAQHLTMMRVPTPVDYNVLRKYGENSEKGRKVLANLKPWRPTTLRGVLTSESLMGWKMHNGVPIRDENGDPITATDTPILTRAEFDAINAVLAEASREYPAVRKDSKALLLRVIICASCGGRMYTTEEDEATADKNYRCNPSARGGLCSGPAMIKGQWAEGYLERELLRMLGAVEFTETHVTPGYDPEPELRATLEEFKAHQEQKGRQKSRAGLTAWQERADALDTRLAKLEAAEKIAPVTTVVRTGRTFASEWANADVDARRRLLQEAGCTLIVRKGRRGIKKLDESRLIFMMDGDFNEAVEALGDPEEAAGRKPAPKLGCKLRIAVPVGVYELPSVRDNFTQAA
ncbi:recombinase family protein [Kitasatospora sp. NPDC002227]|uniref:recombinase family protein n=1 Tax=Kitasatospora sp. NPDC002227 TaxID=3154773 RepID=UPI0033173352